MPRTRIKICGITRPEDAALACDLGVDAIGLNFVGGPRKIKDEQAIEILKAASPMVTTVALLMLGSANIHRSWSEALRALGQELSPLVRYRVRQVYGFTEELIKTLRFEQGDPEMRAAPEMWFPISVSDRKSLGMIGGLLRRLRLMPGALVLDAAVSGQLGGTGRTFDWTWLAEARELEGLPPIVLAGGLTPENVGEAIVRTRPYAVDVSSGVEAPGQPGVKDAGRMRAFVDAVRGADAG